MCIFCPVSVILIYIVYFFSANTNFMSLVENYRNERLVNFKISIDAFNSIY